MKKSILFQIALLFCVLPSCKLEKPKDEKAEEKTYVELPANKFNAVALNNQISSIQRGAVSMVENVFQADTNQIGKLRQDAIFEFDVSINRLKDLGKEHEVANYFSKAVISLLSFYNKEFTGTFIDIISILKKEKLTNSDKNFLNEYDLNFAAKEAELFNEIIVRQDSFASFFNISMAN